MTIRVLCIDGTKPRGGWYDKPVRNGKVYTVTGRTRSGGFRLKGSSVGYKPWRFIVVPNTKRRVLEMFCMGVISLHHVRKINKAWKWGK